MSLTIAPVKCEEKKDEQQHKSAWFQFMKSVATFRGDLTSLTAPPFLLAPMSIVEYSTYWSEHPRLLVSPTREECPKRRALLVLQWFLSTLKHQHASRDENGRRKKMKPLNPFLGEIFLGKWVDDVGTTHLITEQVSHHPPATAYRIWNDAYGVKLEGHISPKAYFSSTINIERQGYGILHIDKYDEDHWITMPKVHVEGIVTFQIAPELSGVSHIRSSSGYTTCINYSSKGWLKGKSNSFTASIYQDNDESHPIYTLEGRWSDSYTIKDGKGKLLETVDLGSLRRTPFQVAPVELQHPLESRRAWKPVIDAINANDIFTTGHEKSKIENAQRVLRKMEKEAGETWTRRYFTQVEEDPIAEKLAIKGINATADRHGRMIWKFDDEKYKRILENQRNGIKSPIRSRFDSGVGFLEIEEV
ncbi:Oxysterol-binding protein [Daldinia caldariorum]|uniref:Oxysterol-binding protein n=1 Tax=Daldinia caldariorum TaxID=326644 RepID=UPI0020083807|nr:Oxysterol-binding protein [Daldinia caldariorum]KAI1465318.1 Oxysterol-binding protein [Daldinia caldariorum]